MAITIAQLEKKVKRLEATIKAERTIDTKESKSERLREKKLANKIVKRKTKKTTKRKTKKK